MSFRSPGRPLSTTNLRASSVGLPVWRSCAFTYGKIVLSNESANAGAGSGRALRRRCVDPGLGDETGSARIELRRRVGVGSAARGHCWLLPIRRATQCTNAWRRRAGRRWDSVTAVALRYRAYYPDHADPTCWLEMGLKQRPHSYPLWKRGIEGDLVLAWGGFFSTSAAFQFYKWSCVGATNLP